MAPFLFLVVAEVLHLMMTEATAKGMFEGVSVGKDKVEVSHLQFADDVVFFGKWNAANIHNLFNILRCFFEVSGLRVNLKKSKLYGIKVPEEEVRDWAGEMGCGYGTLPFTYLGLPVGTHKDKTKMWKPVLDKLRKKLSSWRARWLSFGGRWTLVRSVLGSVSLYFMSLFRSPVNVLKEIERIRCHFFWGGGGERERDGLVSMRGKCWVSWEKVLGSFERGGLNIGSIEDLNLGLLGKWWWRFHSEGECLWRRIIVSIYGAEGGMRETGGKGLGGGVWANILKAGVVLDRRGIPFTNSFGNEVGDGSRVLFWEDRWLPGGSLKGRFPRLYRLEVEQGVTVAERGLFVDGQWEWRWNWRRGLRGRELGEWDLFLRELGDFSPRRGVEDRKVWELGTDGQLEVKELRHMMEQVRVLESGNVVQTEWSKLIPKKVSIFSWRAKLARLPTRATLNDRGIDLDTVLCPRCGVGVETVDHALVACDPVKTLWRKVGRWWGVDVTDVSSISGLEGLVVRGNSSLRTSERWKATVRCLTYLIWANRNQLVFSKSTRNIEDQLYDFQIRVFEWLSSRDDTKKMDWYRWNTSPGGSDL